MSPHEGVVVAVAARERFEFPVKRGGSNTSEVAAATLELMKLEIDFFADSDYSRFSCFACCKCALKEVEELARRLLLLLVDF